MLQRTPRRRGEFSSILAGGAYCVATWRKPRMKSCHLPRMPPSAASRAIPRCRVVIIDDHAAIVEMIRQVVESAGFHVVGSAEEVGAALELCRREQPDLII